MYAQSVPLLTARQGLLGGALEQRTSRFEIACPIQSQPHRGTRLVVHRHRGAVLHFG